MISFEHHRLWAAAFAAALIVTLTACGGSSESAGASATVLSSRADMVSDGSALVGVTMNPGVAAESIKLSLNGSDVTASLKPDRDGQLLGLVTGLRAGDNTLAVTAGGTSTLKIRNTDKNGPIISGPHQTPFVCETHAFKLPDGSTLGPAQDALCNAPTKVMYVYMPQGGTAFKPLPSPAPLPVDVGTTTTSDGRVVKYVLRVETGTLNRAIYQYAVLYDPTTEPSPQPLAAYAGWNRKIVFAFGGSAAAGYQQGHRLGQFSDTLSSSVSVDFGEQAMLSRGYAVMGSSLNVFGNGANDVLSAETASMVKERFIKTFGVPLYTMGWGGSGGSMQQHLIASNYPGILDGITPAASFPDHHSVLPTAVDCALLARAFGAAAQAWTDAQKTAVSGYNTWATCQQWMSLYSPHWMEARQRTNPEAALPGGATTDTSNCPLVLPASQIYDPASNRTGARCDAYSAIRNLIGIDPATGFAARGFDNVGVQYGLKAYQTGAISAEQFVELNERVGGYDGDGNLQAARTAASAMALNNLFEFGRVNGGAQLAAVPIIDFRTNPGLVANVHDSARSMSMRARLVRANGHAGNQVILRAAGSGAVGLPAHVLSRMDAWLLNIRNDSKAYASPADKVVANKPADLKDACFPAAGQQIQETADLNNAGQCGQLMPFFSDTRQVAGAGPANDVLKCQLKPLLRSDHAGLSDAQFARVASVFPAGVCNFAQPSVGLKPLKARWLSYPSPGAANPLN